MHTRVMTATAVAVLGTVATMVSPASRALAGEVAVPTVIAHRGASSHAPENTLASIDKAAQLGFSWVENDVQRTKDGELVVIHDDSLRRTTDVEDVFPGRLPGR